MSLNIREIKIKITKTSPYTYQGGCLPKNKHCQGCEETGTEVHRWWEYKMELLWKTICRLISKTLKQNYHMIQQLHFWIIIHKNWNQDLKELLALLCPLQHHSLQPRGSYLFMDEWINKMWYIYTMKYYSGLKKRKFCNMWQHGWTFRTLC